MQNCSNWCWGCCCCCSKCSWWWCLVVNSKKVIHQRRRKRTTSGRWTRTFGTSVDSRHVPCATGCTPSCSIPKGFRWSYTCATALRRTPSSVDATFEQIVCCVFSFWFCAIFSPPTWSNLTAGWRERERGLENESDLETFRLAYVGNLPSLESKRRSSSLICASTVRVFCIV